MTSSGALGPDGAPLAVAELLGAVAVATDLAKGLPEGHAFRTCGVAMLLADLLGVGEGTRGDVYFVALLRYVGCTATAPQVADALGDELAVSARFSGIDSRDLRAVTAAATRLYEGGTAKRLWRTGGFLAAASAVMGEHERASCEVAALFAARLGLPASVAGALRQAFERWDGRGNPGLARGEAIALPARIVQLAGQLCLAARVAGAAETIDLVAARAARDLDPELVSLAARHRTEVERQLDQETDDRTVLALQPRPPIELDPSALEGALAAVGAVADLKSTAGRGRATAVSARADAAARTAGLSEREVTLARRTGWVQDIGRVAISARIWDKTGPLTAVETEQVRLHPYFSERVLLRCAPLRDVALAAGAHHEREDGSGYFRGTAHLTPVVAVLAVADALEAPPSGAGRGDARDRVWAEARRGALPSWAVEACLGASPAVPPVPAGARLTEREREVLALVVRGATNQQVGSALHISAKTVNTHLEHVFAKLGVTTRGAAAFVALQEGMLPPG